MELVGSWQRLGPPLFLPLPGMQSHSLENDGAPSPRSQGPTEEGGAVWSAEAWGLGLGDRVALPLSQRQRGSGAEEGNRSRRQWGHPGELGVWSSFPMRSSRLSGGPPSGPERTGLCPLPSACPALATSASPAFEHRLCAAHQTASPGVPPGTVTASCQNPGHTHSETESSLDSDSKER